MSEIKEMTDALIKFRDERNWEQFHTGKDLSMCLSIEANELLELLTSLLGEDHVKMRY